jgi:hypothetical protein
MHSTLNLILPIDITQRNKEYFYSSQYHLKTIIQCPLWFYLHTFAYYFCCHSWCPLTFLLLQFIHSPLHAIHAHHRYIYVYYINVHAHGWPDPTHQWKARLESSAASVICKVLSEKSLAFVLCNIVWIFVLILLCHHLDRRNADLPDPEDWTAPVF